MFKKLLTPLIACSFLALVFFAAAPKAQAQAPQLVDCIETSSTPCNTTEPEGNGSQGDKLWLAAGKFNNDFAFLAPLWALPSMGFPCNPSGSADELSTCTFGSDFQLIDGVLSVVGGSGGGSTFQANGTPLSSSSTVDFLNSVTVNGITITFVNSSAGNVQLGLNFPTGQTANEFLASPCGSTGALTLRVLCSSDLPATVAVNTTGNAATASALAPSPTLCTGGEVPTGILPNGNATGCFTPSGSGVTVQTNNTANSSQGVLNFENSVTVNGVTIDFINPSAGNEQIALNFPTGQPANEFLAAPCGSTGALALRVLCASDLPGTIGSNTTGNAATSTALSAPPTVCTGGQVPTGVLANGNATGCFTPSGAGVALDTNNTANSSQTTLNIENSATANGIEVTAANPSTGNVQLGLSFISGQPANEFLAAPCGTTGAMVLRVLCASDIPSSIAANTSGNAATATALSTPPTVCTGGLVPTGVLANGNATGCFTPSGSGVALQTNSTANSSQTTLNIENGGGISVTNTSSGNVLVAETYAARVVSGTTDTILSTDCANSVEYTSASAVAVALPQATGSFATCNVDVIAANAGTVTVTPATSTITNASSLTGTSLAVPGHTSANITALSGNYLAAGPALNPNSGTVTSIICGAGLSGGTITATGTCSLNLSNAQIWAALQQIMKGDLGLLGTSTGYTLLESALTSTSNNTLLLPPTASDTLAGIGTAQTWGALQTFGNNISIGGVTVAGATGTGNNVFATSPNITGANLNTPSAINLANATNTPCAALPAYTGDMTTSAGSCATTVGAVKGVSQTANALGSVTSVTPSCAFATNTVTITGNATINAPTGCTPYTGQKILLIVQSSSSFTYSATAYLTGSTTGGWPASSTGSSKDDHFSLAYDGYLGTPGWVLEAYNLGL